MNRAEKNKMYEKLPLIYNHIMRMVNYEAWAKYICAIACENLINDSKALELGSGNCAFANYFILYYPKLIATDISKNMLAYEKNKYIPKVCCDMTALPFKTKFSLILSAFDSVNYLTNRRKLLKLFKQVSNLISDDGIFTFDASLEKNSLAHAKELDQSGTYNGIKYSQKSEYNIKTRIQTHIFLMKRKSGEVYTEVHRQKIFTFETYFELLELAGLTVKNCYDAFSFEEGNADSERVQFITKKFTGTNYSGKRYVGI